MTTARDKAHYITAWRRHVNELATMALDANMPYAKWIELKTKLYDEIDTAANCCFPNEETKS